MRAGIRLWPPKPCSFSPRFCARTQAFNMFPKASHCGNPCSVEREVNDLAISRTATHLRTTDLSMPPNGSSLRIVPTCESSLAIARPVRLRSSALSGYPRNQSAMPECMRQHTPGS